MFFFLAQSNTNASVDDAIKFACISSIIVCYNFYLLLHLARLIYESQVWMWMRCAFAIVSVSWYWEMNENEKTASGVWALTKNCYHFRAPSVSIASHDFSFWHNKICIQFTGLYRSSTKWRRLMPCMHYSLHSAAPWPVQKSYIYGFDTTYTKKEQNARLYGCDTVAQHHQSM